MCVALWYVVQLTFALVIQYHPITFILYYTKNFIRVSFQQQYYCFLFSFRFESVDSFLIWDGRNNEGRINENKYMVSC